MPAADGFTLRPFAPGDIGPVVALWNRCLTRDPISEERFWRFFLLDENFDPAGAIVAQAGDGAVVGFLQAMVRVTPAGSLGVQPDLGWLTVFFVAPERRRLGIGSRLLEAGLTFLRAKGRQRLLCNGYAPYYIFPGVDEEYREARAFLKAHAFTKTSDPVAMGMPLEGVRMPDAVRARQAALEQEGYSVRMFRREDTLPLFRFAEEHLPGWQPSLLAGLRQGNEEIVLATWNAEIVGYTQWENPYNDPPGGLAGRFGPFGVRPDQRSKGIGAVIFYTLVERVVGRGARYLWFGWAGGRNLSFYERAGCRVTRRFGLYARPVTPPP